VVASWDWLACMPGRFTLASGEVVSVVDLGGGTVSCGDATYTPTPMLSDNVLRVSHGGADPGTSIADGDLMFFGEDAQGAWYAAANHVGTNECPFEMSGGAYDEGDVLHFTSGLVLRKAPNFRIVSDWVEDPFPLRAADQICVNEQGEVLSVSIWLPY